MSDREREGGFCYSVGVVAWADQFWSRLPLVLGEPVRDGGWVLVGGTVGRSAGHQRPIAALGGFDDKDVLLWLSDVEPGSTHDMTAAREHALGALYCAASQPDLPALADNGYDGAGSGAYTPAKQPPGNQVLATATPPGNALPSYARPDYSGPDGDRAPTAGRLRRGITDAGSETTCRKR